MQSKYSKRHLYSYSAALCKRLLTNQARQAQLEGHVTCQGRVWTLSFDFCVHTRCPNTALGAHDITARPDEAGDAPDHNGRTRGRLTKPNRRAQCFIRVLIDACVNVFTLLTAITSPVVNAHYKRVVMRTVVQLARVCYPISLGTLTTRAM